MTEPGETRGPSDPVPAGAALETHTTPPSAVAHFAPAEVEVSVQLPVATVPLQVAVPSLTVTLPVGAPALEVTVNATAIP